MTSHTCKIIVALKPILFSVIYSAFNSTYEKEQMMKVRKMHPLDALIKVSTSAMPNQSKQNAR